MRKGAIAEEQPAAAFRLRRPSLLHKGAEGRDASPGTDHDDVLLGRRQREMLVGLEFHANVATAFQALGDVVRGDAFPRAAMTFIAHSGNEQVRLIPDLAAGEAIE